jgi:hypothetical protein
MITLYSESHTELNADFIIAQGVGRRPLIAEVRVRYMLNPCGIYGRRFVIVTGFFFPEYCDFLLQYNFTNTPRSFTHTLVDTPALKQLYINSLFISAIHDV